MESRPDQIKKPSVIFMETYDQTLRGLEPGETGKIKLPWKHAGLAILRAIESNPDWDARLVGREDVLKVATFFKTSYEPNPSSIISRLQFVIITNKKTGNRFIVDLGSVCGTVLIDCTLRNTDPVLLERAKDLYRLLAEAEVRCMRDKIHGELYAPYIQPENITIVSASITQTGQSRLPNPNHKGQITLQSNLQRFMWYPLAKGVDQTIIIGRNDIGVYVFAVDANSELKLSKEAKEMKATAVAKAEMKAPAGAGMFASTDDTKQKDLEIFNALLAKYRGVEKNFALKDAVEQIEKLGGIEKMDGKVYPEAFKCCMSLAPMKDPVIDENGHSFEQLYTTRLTKSPITNLPYKPGHQFKPNKELKELMTQFYKVKGINPADVERTAHTVVYDPRKK